MSAARSTAAAVLRRLPGPRRLLQQRDRARAQRDAVRRQRDEARARAADLRAALRAAEAANAGLRRDLERTRRQLERSVPYDRPSFAASLERVKRVRRRTLEEHGARHPIWALNAKHAGRDLATSLGVDVPELVAPPATPEELELDLSRPIVVKPLGGSSSRGVIPLVPHSDGRAWSVFDRRAVDADDIRTVMREAAQDPRVSERFIVEELVPSTTPDRLLPDDWKCYAFGGCVELVMQRRPHDSRAASDFRFRWYDGDGVDLGPVRASRHDPTLPRPGNFDRIVEVAEKVAAAVPGPFVRIDLYATAERVVFGELTPGPGGDQKFANGLDERLGEAWERAEAALLVHTYDTPHPG